MQLSDWVKNLLITFIFIISFLWYIFPLIYIYYIYFDTTHFNNISNSVVPLCIALIEDRLGLNDLPAYFSSIITSAGFVLLLFSQKDYKLSAFICAICLFLLILVSAWAAHYMYYKLIDFEPKLNLQYEKLTNNELSSDTQNDVPEDKPVKKYEIGTVLLDFCAGRFKQLITLLFTIFGISLGLGYTKQT